MISVEDAVRNRRSVRAFLDRPVDSKLLFSLLELAARAPSGGNIQPWHIHVLEGDALADFKTLMKERVLESPKGEGTEYPIYPAEMTSPYRERVFGIGEGLYGKLGIPREDKVARRAWFSRNFQFFGAPAGLFCFVDRQCGAPQWSDLGMYLQTLMLLLEASGIQSCAQECWALYPKTIAKHLDVPPDHMLFCGMSIGYADPDSPTYSLQSPRASTEEFLRVHR